MSYKCIIKLLKLWSVYNDEIKNNTEPVPNNYFVC